jgi:hypothetical protein|nr:MAG TPA: deoxyribosyltransferase [Caudoviricetes sp.]
MKIFISQPMRERSNDEIQKERAEMMTAVKAQYRDAEELYTFFDNHEWGPLMCLAKSIEALSVADAAIFAPGWKNARGCRIEHQCCVDYGVPILAD